MLSRIESRRSGTTSTAGPVSAALLAFGVATLASAVPAAIDRGVLTTYWYIVGPLTVLGILWRYRMLRRRDPRVRPGVIVSVSAVVLVATLGVGAITRDISAADTALGVSLAICGLLVRAPFLVGTGVVTAVLASGVGLLGLQPREPLVATLSGLALLIGGLLAVRVERAAARADARDPGRHP